MKLPSPTFAATFASVALAATMMTVALAPQGSECATYLVTSCEQERNLEYLDSLKSQGAIGARAAILTTAAQYNLQQPMVVNSVERAYRQADSRNSECLIESIQRSVASGQLKVAAELKESATYAARAHSIVTADNRMSLGTKDVTRPLTPLANGLLSCLSGTRYETTVAERVGHSSICINDRTPAEDEVCVPEASRSSFLAEINELTPLPAPEPPEELKQAEQKQAQAEEASSARAQREAAAQLAAQRALEAEKAREQEREAASEKSEKPKETSRPGRTESIKPTSPTVKPNVTPPAHTPEPPPEYAENARPVPTLPAAIDPVPPVETPPADAFEDVVETAPPSSASPKKLHR